MTEIAARLKTRTLSEGVEVKGKHSHFPWSEGILLSETRRGRDARAPRVSPQV
jgi:hypothetical protein